MKLFMRLGVVILSILVLVACSSGGGPEGPGSLNPEDNNGKDPVGTSELSISITASQSVVFSEDSITITAKVSGDGAADATVEWTATGGTLSDKSATGATWTAPVEEDDFTITATASHAGVSVTDEVTISVEMDPSRNYLIVSANLPDGTTTTFNQEVALAAAIKGPDANRAQFEWELTEGVGHVFPKTGERVTWDSGNIVGDTTIRVTATAGSDVLKQDLELKVIVPLEIVGVTPASPRVGIGNEVELKVELGGYYADSARVRWSYSSLALEDPNNPGAIRGALVGDSSSRTITYRAPHLHGAQTTIEDLSESVTVSAQHLDSQTQTDPFEVDVNVTFCDAGDWQTANDPCVISNVYQLQGMSDTLEKREGFYKLGSDVDASVTHQWNGGKGFDPLGMGLAIYGFYGELDGAGHTISDLYISRSDASEATGVGLFLNVRGAVRNLNLRDVTVIGNKGVGALTGGVAGDAIIHKVSVTGNSTVRGYERVGGVIGQAHGGGISTVSDVLVEDMEIFLFGESPVGTTGFEGGAGGVIGFLSAPIEISDVTVENLSTSGSYNLSGGVVGNLPVGGTITNASVIDSSIWMSKARNSYFGGIAGYNLGAISDSKVDGGSVSGEGMFVGGVAGYNGEGASITNTSASNQEVSIRNSLKPGVGGFVGRNEGIIKNSSVANQDISGGIAVAGFVADNQEDAEIIDATVVDSVVRQSAFSSSNDFEKYAGFAAVNNGKILRASVIDTTVSGARKVAGGFVGQNGSAGSILDSFVYGVDDAVIVTHSDVGGFAGWNLGQIENAYVILDYVKGGTETIGGFVGYQQSPGYESYTYAFVEVRADSTSSGTIGGFTGEVSSGGGVIRSAWSPAVAAITADQGNAKPIAARSDMFRQSTYEGQGLHWIFTGAPNAVWQMPASSEPGPHTPDLINNSRY